MLRLLLLLLLLTAAVWAQEEGTMGVVLRDGPVVEQGSDELLPGDLILSIDGTSLNGKSFDRALVLCRRPAGTRAPVQVWREGRFQTVEVTWKPYPPGVVEAQVEEVRQQKRAVIGLVEGREGNTVIIVLVRPVARAFSPGALVGVMPNETVVGEGRVTRVLSLYRLEAELKPENEAHLWERVVVTP